MKNKNICKFISPMPLNNLSISCFVLESDPEVMKKSLLLTELRMILVVQGEGKFKFNDTLIPFHAGSLIFGYKDELFSVQCQTVSKYMYIRFDGARAKELLRRFDINKSNRSFDGFEGIIPLWQESLSRAREKTVDLASESILLYTFSRLSGNCGQRDNLISRILEISEENFINPELSLTLISQELGYNSKYISHFFKEKMGVGYSEYLKTLRIKYAVSLIDHGIDSVKNVALLSGFTDPLYFSTVFKKSLGVSPTEYKSGISEKTNSSSPQ